MIFYFFINKKIHAKALFMVLFIAFTYILYRNVDRLPRRCSVHTVSSRADDKDHVRQLRSYSWRHGLPLQQAFYSHNRLSSPGILNQGHGMVWGQKPVWCQSRSPCVWRSLRWHIQVSGSTLHMRINSDTLEMSFDISKQFPTKLQWTRQFRVIDSSGSPSHINIFVFPECQSIPIY